MLYGKKVVVLCISKLNDDTIHSFVTSFNEKLRSYNIALLVYSTVSDMFWNTAQDKGEASVFDHIDYSITDAVIIFEEQLKYDIAIDNIISNAHKWNIPIINIGNERDDCASVYFDHEAGICAAVEHIVKYHKITDIHFIAGKKESMFSQKREEAFRKAMHDNGIAVDDYMISYGDFWSDPAERVILRLIEEDRLPKAIICANDAMAIAVCKVLNAHGIRVPDDICVTGYDGIREGGFSVPKITSVICQQDQLADATAKLAKVAVNRLELPKKTIVQPYLKLSESCGCCAMKPSHDTAAYISYIGNRFNNYQDEERTLTAIGSKMISQPDLKSASMCLKNTDVIFDMCVMLHKDCTNKAADPMTAPAARDPHNPMCLFFDNDVPTDFFPTDFPKEDIIPNLESVLKRGYPIFFLPLNILEVSMGFLCCHYYNYDIKNYSRMLQIVNILNHAISGLRNIRYQRYLNSRLEKTYVTDPLTGLNNRIGFLKEYSSLAEDSSLKNYPMTIIFADLDGLKQINDTYGHGEGDNAIHTVAQALKSICPQGSLCARFGGDEMIAVCPKKCPPEKIMADITRYLDVYNRTSKKPYTVAASVGIYLTQKDDSLDFESLLLKADRLMYENKAEKKAAKEV